MQRLLLSKEFVPTLSRCRARLIAALMLATLVSAAFAQSRAARMQGAGASSEDGAWSLSTGPGGRGLAKIAVLDTDNHRVDVFDRNGNGLGQFDQGFDLPTGIAPDAGSNLYVKDGNTHCQADKFDNKGQFLFQFGACANSGIGLGVFDNLGSLAVDASGNVWVTSPTTITCRRSTAQGTS